MGPLACCLLLVCCVAVSSARPVPAGEGLGFGLIATSSPNVLRGQWQPLLDDMAAAIGVPVTARLFDDYAGVIWAMAAGHVQMAWLGNKSAIEAVDRAGAEVVFQAVEADGRTEYNAVLLARSDSGLRTVEDVFARAGELTYGDGDSNSTSGHVIPGHYLFAPRRIEPRTVFRRVVQNNHEANFLGVAEGRLDVATGNTINLAGSMARHPEAGRAVAVIWTSPPIPSDPLVWRTDLDNARQKAIRSFLLGYGRETPGKTPQRLTHEQAVLEGMHRAGFRTSDNRQLISVRRIELTRQRSCILADAGLPPDERLSRLAAIDAGLAALPSAD